MDLTKEIKKAVKAKGMTMTEFYKKTGISKNTFYNWEQGADIPISKVEIMLNELKLSADKIMQTTYYEETTEYMKKTNIELNKELLTRVALDMRKEWIHFCEKIIETAKIPNEENADFKQWLITQYHKENIDKATLAFIESEGKRQITEIKRFYPDKYFYGETKQATNKSVIEE